MCSNSTAKVGDCVYSQSACQKQSKQEKAQPATIANVFAAPTSATQPRNGQEKCVDASEGDNKGSYNNPSKECCRRSNNQPSQPGWHSISYEKSGDKQQETKKIQAASH